MDVALKDAKTTTSQKSMSEPFPNVHAFGEYLPHFICR